MTALYALPLIALAGWLGYKAGKRRATNTMAEVLAALANGEAQIDEDGTVRLSDSDYVEDQREAASWQ